MPTKINRRQYRLWHGGSGVVLTGPFGDIPTVMTHEAVKNVDVTDTLVTSSSAPTWRADIRAGKSATTEMYGTRFSRKQKYGSVSYRHTGGSSSRWSGQLLWNDVSLPNSADSSLVTIADNRAIADLVKKYRERSRDFQAIPFFGEFREMVRGVARPSRLLKEALEQIQGRSLKKLGLAARRPRSYSVRTLLHDLADDWLSWSFNISPTLHDLDDALKAARHLASGRTFENVRVRGFGASEDASVSVIQSGYNAGSVLPNSAVAIDFIVKQSASVRYEFAFSAGTPSGELTVPQTVGTTLSDFVPGLYEIIPYSWLFDYFANMQDILDAWSLGQVRWAWGQRTTRSSRSHEARSMRPVNPELSAGGYTAYTEASGGQLKLSRTDVVRVPLTSVPVPTFNFEIPGMGSRKWLNLLAFVSGRKEARRLSARL